MLDASGAATLTTPVASTAHARQLRVVDVGLFYRERSGGIRTVRLHDDWLNRERDIDGDGLLSTIYPDESGLDDSPKYDDVFGWMRHDSTG